MNIPIIAQKYLDEVTRAKYNKDFVILSKKNPDLLLKIITPIVMLFNKKFNTGFITILFGKMWMPYGFEDDATDERWLGILIHETFHEMDRKKFTTPLFTFMYLFPQVLTLLSLLALGAIWGGPVWLWWLACLLFLAPLPAPFRMWFELRAYRTNLLFGKKIYKYNNVQSSFQKKYIAQNFTGPNYYFSWPFKDHVLKMLNDESYRGKKEYKEIEAWLDRNYEL